MTFRLYNKKRSQYEQSCRLAIKQDGNIIESVGDVVLLHESKNFIVEPWTGYFDSNGKKIHCGDILEMRSMFDFKSKVVWKNGAFKLIPIDPEGLEEDMGRFGILKGWAVTGNIHDAEFLDR